MTEPSSQDLHPKTGARFVFDRITSEPEPAYTVVLYLPGGRDWTGTLRWIDGAATLELVGETDLDELVWAKAEAIKLARILHRDPKPHMLRWRGPSS